MYYTQIMTHPGDDGLARRGELLDAWVEKRREIARLEAQASALLARRIDLYDDDCRDDSPHREAMHRSMVAEYSAAAHMGKGAVEYAFADAAFLASDHPGVREAFEQGDISAAHVREIVRAGSVVREAVREGRVDAATLGLYDTAAVVAAVSDSPARVRALVRQVASALAGETVVDRHRRAAGERAVTIRSVDDGLALLQVVLPEHLAVAILDRLTRLAQQVMSARDDREPILSSDGLDAGEDAIFLSDLAPDDPRRDDPVLNEHDISGEVIFGLGTFVLDPGADAGCDDRTIDQVRTDLLTDLLLASDPTESRGTALDSIQARIQVTIAAGSLLGSDDRPAELDGLGPLDPDIARDLAGRTGGWSRLLLDSSGMVTATDAYSPTEAMKRHLRARDQHCRFPGCRMPVHRCQIDHHHDHAKGGRTCLANLAHFCAGHHVLKHPDVDRRFRWTARQTAGGDVEWTSPLGRVHRDPAPRRVMFV